jgi:hypothetical protein
MPDASRRQLMRLLASTSIADAAIRFPPNRATNATVLGLANERFFPVHGSSALEAEFAGAMERQARALGIIGRAISTMTMPAGLSDVV